MINIKKIFLFCFLFILSIIQVTKVSASSTVLARIRNNYFGSLEEAINAANSTDIINLTSDIALDETLKINKTININLNNHDIKADERVFLIQGGSLNLSGTGMIYESKPNYGAITLIGSDDPIKKDYSTVSVGSGVTLEGWSGIFINQHNNTGYGILVNMDGGINAVNDVNGGAGVGIYVNGNIQHEENSPIINLSNTARISSSGNGVYAAGYATYNINGAYISGSQSGLGIKSGVFNISDGIIRGSGEDKTPTSGNNNGINASGTAIQIESNSNYKGNIEINIQDGKFESENSNVIYEYTVNNTPTEVKKINIVGGSFISNAEKPVFSLSDSFKNTHQEFIYGGTYSSNPLNYLKNGYSAYKNENSLYEVINSTISVFSMNGKSENSLFTLFITIVSLVILGIIFYLNFNRVEKIN